jgi:hypothetical protein
VSTLTDQQVHSLELIKESKARPVAYHNCGGVLTIVYALVCAECDNHADTSHELDEFPHEGIERLESPRYEGTVELSEVVLS